jgi:nucleotide-binding universal stress UspA family protein
MTYRCDRALDRASQLADAWNAELIAAHVVDPAHTRRFYRGPSSRWWRKIPDPVERMRRRLRRDLAGTMDNMRVILEEGEPAEKLVEIAAREECDLVVTGTARDESIERMILGSTITRLVRATQFPVLMVQDRGMRPYRRITVATDFSDASFRALLTTGALFPECSLALFHAYDIPFAGFVTDRDFTRDLEAMEDEVRAKVMSDDRIDPAIKRRITVVIEHGHPEALLEDFIEAQQMDLTVIGSHGRGAVFDALIGSTAKRLVETLEGDLLIVRLREGDG